MRSEAIGTRVTRAIASPKAGDQQILGLNDADDLMRAALHDRKTRMGAVADFAPVLLFRIVEVEPLDLGTRRHYGARSPVAKAQRHLDDSRLGLMDVAGRGPLAQHEADFLVSN